MKKTYHLLFEVGIITKLAISAVEIVVGIVFYYFNYATIASWVLFFTGDELTETPRDVIWNYIVHAFGGFFATSQSVWAFIFLAHGIIKTLLAVGIVKNIRWTYPAGAIVFALFVIYQGYQYFLAPSFALIAISVFDIAVIVLVMHEYYYGTVTPSSPKRHTLHG